MGEIGCGSDEEDGVRVDEAGDAVDIDLVRWGGTRYQVNLDLEVVASLSEGRVSSLGKNPVTIRLANPEVGPARGPRLTSRVP